MWNLVRYAFISIVFGSLVSTTIAQAQLFVGSLLDDNQNSNNNIPLIGALGLGSNNNQNTMNANRGLLSVLGGNANVNRPNTNNLNNFNRYPNTGQTNPNNNVNNIKNKMKEAEKVLERLKELEKQKLEREKESPGQAGKGSDNPKTDNSDNENINIKDDHKKTGVLKSLTKRKFYFMVRPVVPENEALRYEQTVYYED